MADFKTAVAGVLANEGAKLLNDPKTGEYSRYGVTLKTAAACGFCAPDETKYIFNLTEDGACAFYLQVFWTPLLLAGVNDQAKANKILDMAVNMGTCEAVKLTQVALNDLHATLSMDYRMGPETLAAINAADTFQLLAELRASALAFYHKLVERAPDKYSKYWESWKTRAQQ